MYIFCFSNIQIILHVAYNILNRLIKNKTSSQFTYFLQYFSSTGAIRMNEQAQLYVYSSDRLLVWVGGSEAVCVVPDKDPVPRFVQHGGVVAATLTLAPQHQLAQLLV